MIEPPNILPRIDAIWAWLSVDEAGNEGVIAATMGPLGLMPLIAADKARLEQLRPIAEAVAHSAQKRARLVRFTSRVVEDEIDGRN